jgi:hypothetical protein
MQPELLMAGETVHGKTDGCTALADGRMRRSMGHGCELHNLTMHTDWGLQCGHSGMHSCALG